jgi:hypothetical protein
MIDNFSYLIDTLGDPIISNKNWGDKHKWVIKFNLEMDISIMNNALYVISKLKSIIEDIEDIISASERLSDYYFQMSIKEHHHTLNLINLMMLYLLNLLACLPMKLIQN